MNTSNETSDYKPKGMLGIYFYLFLFLSVVLSLANWNILTGVTLAFILILITIPFVYIGEMTGRKKHIKMAHSTLFDNLQREGFKLEKLGNFNGLIGNRRGYACRIFYEWNKEAKGFLSFGDIVLLIYYQPLLKAEKMDGVPIIDDDKLIELNKGNSGLFSKTNIITTFTPCFVKRSFNYYQWTSAEKILKELDGLIEETMHLKLPPQSITDVRKKEMEYAFFYFTENDFLVAYFEKRKSDKARYNSPT